MCAAGDCPNFRVSENGTVRLARCAILAAVNIRLDVVAVSAGDLNRCLAGNVDEKYVMPLIADGGIAKRFSVGRPSQRKCQLWFGVDVGIGQTAEFRAIVTNQNKSSRLAGIPRERAPPQSASHRVTKLALPDSPPFLRSWSAE